MTLSIESEVEIDNLVGSWCLARVEPHLKHSIDFDYEISGQAVTIYEVRPVWRGPPGDKSRLPIARLRFVKTIGRWKLFWLRANGKWISYEPVQEVKTLKEGLLVIESDRYGCFFG
jgi:hypothetical protein